MERDTQVYSVPLQTTRSAVMAEDLFSLVETRSGMLIFASALLLVIFFFYRVCYAPYQVLKRYGIKGPTPLPLIGNYFQMAKRSQNLQFSYFMYKTYGPVSGFYLGKTPCVFVLDPELIKQVTVKDFDSFMDRMTGIDLAPEPYAPQGLLQATGEVWRDKRHALTPAFSAAKMKMMVPLIKRSTDTLVAVFGEKAESGESIEVMTAYGAFTLESILAAAFGRVINIQRGEADEVTKAAKGVFDSGKNGTVRFCLFLLMMFPFLQRFVHYFLDKFTDVIEPWKVLHHTALKLIEARRTGTAKAAKYKDILQLMIDASDDTTDGSEAATSSCPVDHASTSGEPSASKHKLTARDIVGSSVTFLLAGYETTANTLSYTSYLLAINPDIQEKLQSEIDSYFDDKPEATLYEASQEITYLDNVIQETLRIYPPAPVLNRTCIKTTTLNDNLTIPKGAVVLFTTYWLQHDPKYWDDPEKFNPDRFTAEERAKRPATVHLPFGFGPRNCIGMRFALLEAKIALINLLQKYTFVRAPDTEVPLETTVGFTLTPKNKGIFLKVVPRS